MLHHPQENDHLTYFLINSEITELTHCLSLTLYGKETKVIWVLNDSKIQEKLYQAAQLAQIIHELYSK